MDHIGSQRHRVRGGGVENCILAEIQVNNLSQDEDKVLSGWTVNNDQKWELKYTTVEI
jgi:hypothetical protein